MGEVIIAFARPDGYFNCGVFLVDVFCLGIKNAFYTEISKQSLLELIGNSDPDNERAGMVDPACARHFIEKAAAYAQRFGFNPHPDYKKARKIFKHVPDGRCACSFAFGHEGKPLFIAGPHDSHEKCQTIIRVLTARCGKDGFHYLVGVPDHLVPESVEQQFK
ncbi:MAG: hypothetical protein PHV34_23470 [Verrucomicrobiae bacterium]|nr:hypothetical protein [Verrucomicrobiae bacterium]